MTDITDSVYVVNSSLVIIRSVYFSILCNFNSDLFESYIFGPSVSTNSEQDSIVNILNLVFSLLVSDYFSSLRVKSYFDWDCLFYKLYPRFFHIISNFVGHMLVEAS
jgi:hypothetical protein